MTGACSMRAPSARCFFQVFGLPILSCRKRRRAVSSYQQALQGQPRAHTGYRHGLYHGRALRSPYPADAEALCRTPKCDSCRPRKRAGEHVRIDFAAGRNAPDLRLQGRRSDRRLVARMLQEGLYGEALSDWTMGPMEPRPCSSISPILTLSTPPKLGKRILRLI